MAKTRNVKLNILKCIAASLLCATLFSMPFVGSLYARYTTSTSGSVSAGVTEFNITQEGEIFNKTIQAKVAPGETQVENIVIKNTSGVATKYTLTVKNVTGNITPLKFKLTKHKAADVTTPEPTENSSENGVSISSVQQQAGEHTDRYYLSIVWDANEENPDYDLAFIGMVDYITVSLTVTQADVATQAN